MQHRCGRHRAGAQTEQRQDDPRPDRQTGRTPAVTPLQSAVLRLQETAGNKALSRLLAGTRSPATVAGSTLLVVQRNKTEQRVRGSYKQRALRSLRTAEYGPEIYRRMKRMLPTDTIALQGLEEADDEIEAEVDALRQRYDIVYGDPAIDRSEGRRRLALIERSASGAFDNLLLRGSAFTESAKEAVEHEWGLGISRTSRGEAMLIKGDPTGVSWPDKIVRCLTPIAHSHPYFERGAPRTRHGAVSTATKEIADHEFGDQTVHGAVLWAKLDNHEESNEMQKIFPSASDVAFAARKGVKTHTVYTPYLVLDHAAGKVVANPNFNQGTMAAASRLRFEIRNACHVQGQDYGCELAAFVGDAQFWTKRIVTQGDGQFSPLKW